MKKVSRQAALSKGLPRYFTGKTCKHGHRAERFTSTSSCCACQDKHNKEYRRTEKSKMVSRARYDRIYREDPARFLYDRALGRSRRKDLPFDLTVEYIRSIWPSDNKCPVFGIELAPEVGEPGLPASAGVGSPSLDRIDPKKGYVQGNVAVISMKANQIKASATDAEDLRRVAKWMASSPGSSYEDDPATGRVRV